MTDRYINPDYHLDDKSSDVLASIYSLINDELLRLETVYRENPLVKVIKISHFISDVITQLSDAFQLSAYFSGRSLEEADIPSDIFQIPLELYCDRIFNPIYKDGDSPLDDVPGV